MHEDRKAKEVMVEGSLHQQFPPFFFWLKKNKQTKQTVPPRATQAVRFLFHFNAAKTQPSTVQYSLSAIQTGKGERGSAYMLTRHQGQKCCLQRKKILFMI